MDPRERSLQTALQELLTDSLSEARRAGVKAERVRQIALETLHETLEKLEAGDGAAGRGSADDAAP